MYGGKYIGGGFRMWFLLFCVRRRMNLSERKITGITFSSGLTLCVLSFWLVSYTQKSFFLLKVCSSYRYVDEYCSMFELYYVQRKLYEIRTDEGIYINCDVREKEKYLLREVLQSIIVRFIKVLMYWLKKPKRLL